MSNIIVVDDVHDLADSLAMFLTLKGHQVRTAYNGLEAVIAAKAERPDVVVLDLNMPVMDGFRAAREIRDRYRAPPPVLVAASALSANSVQPRLDECGFDYFLTKPADIDRLLSIVEQAGEGTRSGA
jgi:CheY-like chemotaxis protein